VRRTTPTALAVLAALGLAARGGQKVIAGIRPEDIGLAKGDDPAERLAADVRMVEPLGSELLVYFSIDAPAAGSAAPAAGGEPDTGLLGQAHNGVARLDPRSGVRPAFRVTFAVDVTRLHSFDPDTGLALFHHC
jgi:multiple sugar transport system ATP-binding protein